jgi:dimethylhistidine N-methyltransferase
MEPASGARIVLRNTAREHESPYDLEGDARAGLSSKPRTLPSKYFYDARGSHLFEMITRLPEYYLTRAETEILEREAGRLVESVRPRVLVEFGSGAARKTRILLDAMRERGLLEGYGSVDVSAEASRRAARTLMREYPDIRVEGVIGDFERPRDLPFPGRPRLLAFLGSTIGNMEAAQATRFLGSIRREMTPADAFLVGFDLVKDVHLLERAYNDEAGVTAKFNLNVLRVLNRDLGATFDPEAFLHRAEWNEEASRIEMHLESTANQVVRIPSIGLDVSLAAGETIRTELSHKYTRESAGALLAAAGYRVESWSTDASDGFALALARAAEEDGNPRSGA